MSVITDILKKINFMPQSRFESTIPSNDELYAVEVNLENDRWDGEIHYVGALLNDTNAKADTIILLNNETTIPNDKYDYLVNFTLQGYHNGNTNLVTYVYTDEMYAANGNQVTEAFPHINCGTNTRQGINTFTIIVKSGFRFLHKNNTGGKYSSNNILWLNWYRRIGSNED